MPNPQLGARQDYRGAAAALTLSADLNDTAALTFAVTGDTSGWPSGASGRNFAAVMDRGTAKEEKILVATLASGTMNLAQRGYDGTSPKQHSSGAMIEHFGLSADKADNLDAHVFDQTRDDHAQYLPLNGLRGFTALDQVAGTPVSIGSGANLSGSALLVARADHVHAIKQAGIDDSAMFKAGVVAAAALGAAAVGNTSVLVSGTRLHTNVANAAALPATPQVGDTAYQLDLALFLTYVGPTNRWTAPWNMPWGHITEAAANATTDLLVTGTDVPGCVVTFTAVANRKYRITGNGSGTTVNNPATPAQLVIATGVSGAGTTLAQASTTSVANAWVALTVTTPVQSPTAGSTSYHLRGFGNAWRMMQGATNPWVISVEDVGPNGLPS